jgi:hypothetical protein
VPARRRVPLLLVVGLLLAQAGWLLSVPAFRGIDEFDHVYRAASVARGEWLPSGEQARHGRGELVTVPRDLVRAAGPECRARPYTGPDNCSPVGAVGGGAGNEVRVASAAARYEPLYYWVVGTAARWTSGAAAVLVMRLVSMLLCAAVVGLAAWTVRRWARTSWPLVTLVVSLTPVVVYSGIVVAPNALEVVAATSLWVALVGLAAGGIDHATERGLLLAAVPGAVLLATLRSLGVGFLVVTLLVVALVLGRDRSTGLLRRHRRILLACTAVVSVAVLGGVAWDLLAAPNRLEEHADNPGVVLGSVVQLPVWVLQTIAAAPGRTDPAPPVVYLLVGAVLATVSWVALRRAVRRVRTAMLALAGLSLAGPLAMTLWTYRDVGVIWQGRYGMPLSVGILVLGGLALDRAGAVLTRGRLLAAAAAVTAGQLVAVLDVLREQTRVSPSVAAGLWHAPGPWLVGGLTLLGWALVTRAVLHDAQERAAGPGRTVDAAVDAAVDAGQGQLRAVR